MTNKEFIFLGINIEKISIIYGAFLILWGVSVSFLSGSESVTSFIPSFFGIPILIFAVLTILFPERKKLFMHIIVLIGLIIFLGGLDFLRSLSNPFENIWADSSKLMLLVTGLIFTYINVKSFIFIRKNRD
ncbi:hypothetical protein N9T42_01880 [SAR86 cluster bacterium]|jgi:hypothetical protein|nr:hypothetical protein [SAR86 cluster bacterium]